MDDSQRAQHKSPVQDIHRIWYKTKEKDRLSFDHDHHASYCLEFIGWVANRCCLDLKNRATKCCCMKVENVSLDERVECAYFLESFALKSKQEQQLMLLQWMRYAEAMRRETGAAKGAAKTFLLPGSNITLICGNAMARLIGFSRRAWSTVKLSYQSKELPSHGLIGKAGNKKNQSHDDLLVEFFERTKSLAEPRATKIIRELVDGEVVVDFKDDDDKLDLPAYMSKRGMYKKLIAECHWEYTYSQRYNIIEKKKISPDAAPSVPSWPSFLSFWKKHYPTLVIQSSAEDICGDCHIFAHAYKTLAASKKSKKATEQGSDDSDSNDDSDKDEAAATSEASIPDLDDADGM